MSKKRLWVVEVGFMVKALKQQSECSANTTGDDQ